MIDQKTISQIVADLRAIRDKKRISYTAMAKEVGMKSPQALTMILEGISRPTSATVYKLQDYITKIANEEAK